MPVTTEGITAVFARLQDGYARLDAAALAANYAEDCVVESPTAGVHVGRVAVEGVIRMVLSAFPDVIFHHEEFLIFGDRAVWTTRIEGTDNGGFMGLPPTGKPFNISVIFLFTFNQNHQIVHERRVYDHSRLLLQLAGDAGPATKGPQLYREMLERTRQEHELKIAGEIQRALAPERHHTAAGFEIAAASVPCRAIGGDFFDYFDLPNAAFGFALGDVSGKGPPAALLAAEIQGILAAHSYSGSTPADTLARINDVLTRRPIDARFATVWYGVLSSAGCLTHCNAGHNPPLLVGRHGFRRLDRGGLIVGAFKQATFEEETVQLDPGDVLVVFSDGITEALNTDGEEFGEERLLSCVKDNLELAPTALLERLLDTVHQFTTGAAQNDDVTLLVLRYVGASAVAA
jgi:predicted ester cyclase/serine/threonine protein phosphatase PrpC